MAVECIGDDRFVEKLLQVLLQLLLDIIKRFTFVTALVNLRRNGETLKNNAENFGEIQNR